MAKRWTEKDDGFLIAFCEAVDPDYIATHDLGRPQGSGSRRLAARRAAHAERAWLEREIADIRFRWAAGHIRGDAAISIAMDELADMRGRLAKIEVRS